MHLITTITPISLPSRTTRCCFGRRTPYDPRYRDASRIVSSQGLHCTHVENWPECSTLRNIARSIFKMHRAIPITFRVYTTARWYELAGLSILAVPSGAGFSASEAHTSVTVFFYSSHNFKEENARINACCEISNRRVDRFDFKFRFNAYISGLQEHPRARFSTTDNTHKAEDVLVSLDLILIRAILKKKKKIK